MDRKKPENPAKKAFRFGNFEVFPNVYLSPMAGVTDLAFRRLLRSLAGGRVGLMVSEFVSTEAIRNTRTHELKGLRFDAVVVDPPTFSKNKGKTFRVERDLPELAAGAAALLAPGGLLLFGTNCSAISAGQLVRTVRDVLSSRGRASRVVFSGGQGSDFPEAPGARESHLAVVALEAR